MDSGTGEQASAVEELTATIMTVNNMAEEYIKEILTLKFKIEEDQYKEIKKDYEKYETFTVGKLDQRDQIEKNMLLLGISRKLFTHSLPLAVAEQCYMKLLKDGRVIKDTKQCYQPESAT